ncbi:hypothetical protein [Peribacillus frigoritolerans]|uniref:hypothetical protein n=1 Tax=Peribacillus frigoritolerans TaxID=450367 RepID=UPI003D2738C6
MKEKFSEYCNWSTEHSFVCPPGGFVTIIEAWTDYVREEMDNKAMKKTLTIPKWLNDAAELEGINFSQLLQFAIKERLGIKRKN